MEFRIKKQEYVNRTFRLTKELAEQLSMVAQEQNCSVNELVVQSCEFALNHMEKTDNK
jgi:predicted HicB family RNase H-like nuclease